MPRNRRRRPLRFEALEKRLVLSGEPFAEALLFDSPEPNSPAESSLDAIATLANDAFPGSTLVSHEPTSFAEDSFPTTPAASLQSVSVCNSRHVLVIVVHGFQQEFQEPAWSKRIRRDVKAYLNQHPAMNFANTTVGRYIWASGLDLLDAIQNKRKGASTKAYASRLAENIVAQYLNKLPAGHKSDVLLIGHSRGGILVNEAARYLGRDSRVDYLQTIMLDPTASSKWHDDSYPSQLAPGVDYGIRYHDQVSLNPSTGSVFGNLLGRVVDDQRSISGINSKSESMAREIWSALRKLPSSTWKGNKMPSIDSMEYKIASHQIIHDGWRVTRMKRDLASFLQRKDRFCTAPSDPPTNTGAGTIYFNDNAPERSTRGAQLASLTSLTANERSQAAVSSYQAGDTVSTQLSVVNEGAAGIGTLDLRFMLSADEQVTTSDVQLKRAQRPGVAPFATREWSESITLPTGLSPGIYYAGVIAETSRSARLVAAPFEIRVTANPTVDLAPKTLLADLADGIPVGQTIPVTTLVENAGSSSSGGYEVAYYLHDKAPLADAPVLLKQVTRSSISGGGSQQWTESVAIPSGLDPNQFGSISIVVDASNAIHEVDESNNAISQFASIAEGVDLRPIALDVPDTALPGDTVSIGVTVRNNRGATSDPFNVTLRLSRDADVTTADDDIPVDSFPLPSIAADASRVSVRDIVLPDQLEGAFFVVATLHQEKPDADITNDLLVSPTPIRLPIMADLIADEITMSLPAGQMPIPGSTYSVETSVLNGNSSDSGSFTFAYYLRLDNAADNSGDVLVKSVTRPSVAGFGAQQWTESLTLPSSLASGNYHLVAIADPQNNLLETNEQNNEISELNSIRYVRQVDLTTTSLGGAAGGPLFIHPGLKFPVATTVQNLAGSSSGEFAFSYYLVGSDDVLVDESSVLLKRVTRPSISGGGSQQWTESIAVPESFTPESCTFLNDTNPCTSDYRIIGIADSDDEIVELNEPNNRARSDTFPVSFFGKEGGASFSFDFGTTSSPVGDGLFKVDEATQYSTSLGYGWQSGVVGGFDWGSSDPLLRDLNYTSDATFALDVPNGFYTVGVLLGDGTGPQFHDQMGVYLEGTLVDVVNTAPGQNTLKVFYGNVDDGQLTLRLRDLGGFDAFVPIVNLVVYKGRYVALDFGTTQSPIADGFFQVHEFAQYSPAAGYGWLGGFVRSHDWLVSNSVERDVNYVTDATFVANAPNGQYGVIVVLGERGPNGHDQMGVFLEGTQVDTVDTAPGEVAFNAYSVYVNDGQLTLRLQDLGGADPDAAVVSVAYLEIPIGPAPQVTNATLTAGLNSPEIDAVVVGSAERILLEFSKAIDDDSFTIDDIAEFSGPGGSIVPTAINKLSVNLFELVFPAQTMPGQYALTIGPSIKDLYGRELDQDQDGTIGEPSDDRFTFSFTLDAAPGVPGLKVSQASVNGNQGASVSGKGIRQRSADGPIGSITVEFTDAVEDGSFTVEDVALLSGPSGSIAPTAVNKISDTMYEIVIPTQSESGDYILTIGADIQDTAGNSFNQSGDFGGNPRFTTTFNVVAPNQSPAITSSATVNSSENQTHAIDVQSSDPEGETEGAGLSYSLSGGADQALFSITPATGVLTFQTAPDFESQADADGNNVYEVQVTVADSEGLTDVQDLQVTVVDVIEKGWQNPRNALDVNDDGTIAPDDVLLIVNSILANGAHELPEPVFPANEPPPFLDPTGDEFVAPDDALLVINALVLPGAPVTPAPPQAEGELAGWALNAELLSGRKPTSRATAARGKARSADALFAHIASGENAVWHPVFDFNARRIRPLPSRPLPDEPQELLGRIDAIYSELDVDTRALEPSIGITSARG